MDGAAFFEDPVTEELAPGYSKVIKYPMCLQVGLSHRTWAVP